MKITFWGVQGSCPFSSPRRKKFGTNTPCVELRGENGDMLIFDAGTGLVALGEKYLGDGSHPKNIHILASHFHWDHIQGLPFYKPLYSPNYHLKIYGPPGLAWALACQMSRPHFPVAFTQLPSTIELIELSHMQPIQVANFKITPFEVNHPQQTYGYRVDEGIHSFVYATDHEPDGGSYDQNIITAAKNTDLLVIDAQYTEREMAERRGWGHGTYGAAARIANGAGAKRMIIFHHDPFHSDRDLADIERQAKKLFKNTALAMEGATETIGGGDIANFKARPASVKNGRG